MLVSVYSVPEDALSLDISADSGLAVETEAQDPLTASAAMRLRLDAPSLILFVLRGHV